MTVLTGAGFVKRDNDDSIQLSNGDKISFGYFINAAGGYADKIAHAFDVGRDYIMLPFRACIGN